MIGSKQEHTMPLDLGTKIRVKRAAAQISQRVLAQLLGPKCHWVTVNRWENSGDTSPIKESIIDQIYFSKICPHPSFLNPAKRGTPFFKGKGGGISSPMFIQLWTD